MEAEKQKGQSSLSCFVATAGGCRNSPPYINRSCLNVAEMVLQRFWGKVQLQAVWETSHLWLLIKQIEEAPIEAK